MTLGTDVFPCAALPLPGLLGVVARTEHSSSCLEDKLLVVSGGGSGITFHQPNVDLDEEGIKGYLAEGFAMLMCPGSFQLRTAWHRL